MAALPGKLVITLNDDGSIKTDARKLEGDEAAIMAELQALAGKLGGDLEVEKHIEGAHHHHHGKGGHHHHN